MPAPVDHDQRRSQIIEGLLAVAGREGLDKVTMRSVASAAGVSLRLVQYYFGTKEQLLQHTLDKLERDSIERWQRRLDRFPADTDHRAILETYLDEALPIDEAGRRFHIIYRAFTAYALTEETLDLDSLAAGPRRLRRRVADIISAARAAGETRADLDAELEASRLLALEHGVSTGILIGLHSVDTARRVLGSQLDELFSP